jgi:hypothetical protein
LKELGENVLYLDKSILTKILSYPVNNYCAEYWNLSGTNKEIKEDLDTFTTTALYEYAENNRI